MASIALDQFLSESVIAKRAKVPVRVVFRTTRMTPGAIDIALRTGEVHLDGEPVCELVAGGETIASGDIVERDGRYYFKAKESGK